jgi:hypothetical protein
MVYPTLLPLMRTPWLSAVDLTDVPSDLNGLVRFAERRNLVSARVPSYFKLSLPTRNAVYFHKEGTLFYPRDNRGCPQFLYENSGSISLLDHNHYLPDPLRFRVRSSPEHLMRYSQHWRQCREITNSKQQWRTPEAAVTHRKHLCVLLTSFIAIYNPL